jgi:hypothetical protein
MNSVLSRFVTSRCNDATLIGPSADNHRSPAKLRPFQQFHGHEEGVHVDVQNRGYRIRRSLL